MGKEFSALVLNEASGKVQTAIQDLDESELPEGEVVVRVEYSDVNYKDGLVVAGLGKLVRNYPHVPGIDFAGIVESSTDERYSSGDRVVLTGWGVGERHWGGYAGKARVKADWLVPLPEALSTRQAMVVGTAGFTAMLCVMALEEQGLEAGTGEVLVTGAAGGVGSIAIALLAELGHRVVASTGRPENEGFLRDLGAAEILPREALSGPSERPLEKGRWSGAVDTVGGAVLSRLLLQLAPGGTVAACGNAGGIKLETNVLPFILRGVKLVGIDSVSVPYERRVKAWGRLAQSLKTKVFESVADEVPLDNAVEACARILKGEIRGRTIIRL